MTHAAWRKVLNLEAPIRRFSSPHVACLHPKPIGEAVHPKTDAYFRHPYVRPSRCAPQTPAPTDGTQDIDSVTTAEAHIYVRAEEV